MPFLTMQIIDFLRLRTLSCAREENLHVVMSRTMLKVGDLLVGLTSRTKMKDEKHENRAVRRERKAGKGIWRKLCS
jgi:hypothetical protein